jgi:hypothetical protein
MGLLEEGIPPLDIRPGFQAKFRSLGREYLTLLVLMADVVAAGLDAATATVEGDT